MKSKTVPVMANAVPWNELVLRGERQYKTIHFNWKHRGKVLLYSSKTIDRISCGDYGLSDSEVKRFPTSAIVGFVTVTGVQDDCYGYNVLLEHPKRFKQPIPFKPPRGAIRIFRAPASLLRRRTDGAKIFERKQRYLGLG